MRTLDASGRYFSALTGLRAVAAYLVYAHHAKPHVPFATSFFDALSREGHMGVSLFFVLSGFLIALRYSQSFKEKEPSGWRLYFLHRVARIYPVYLICTIIALVFRQDFRPGSWLVNLFLAQGLFPQYSFTGIGVGWSMTVEVCFYAAAPWVLLYWQKLGLFRWFLMTLLAGGGLLLMGQMPLSFPVVPDWNFLLRSTFFGRCFEFYIGIWCAKRYLLSPAQPFVLSRRATGVFTYVGVFGVLTIMLLIAPALALLPDLPPLKALSFHIINNFLLPVFIGSLVTGLALEKTALARLLGSRIGEALGKGSYIFYLAHYTFGFDVLYFHVWQNKGGVLLLLALASVAGYYVLEAPLHKKALKMFSPRSFVETKSL
ncbi:acyltransferase family protein [Rufibacter hautae]|uniref:Acyltransferase n=1 Tax=Rufibacter hautae TaxID=2595005 RepID=A0A5B6TK41_9BACT|nr:acyltransferase [Rufibacter hautae]KAA3439769.1 acyltransferase [Rufibacter hautae]